MDQPLKSLDQHFQMPTVREIDPARPFKWLRMGLQDLLDDPLPSLTYGVLFALVGAVIFSFVNHNPSLFMTAATGFLLIGPMTAAGLYEIARREEEGDVIGFVDSLRGLRPHAEQLMQFGLFLAIILVVWERTSAILFALFDHGDTAVVSFFFRDIFLSGAHLDFVVAYIVAGGLLAALVFALSAVAIPMLMHRDTDIVTAMMSSARAVLGNLRAMVLWAAVIAGLIAIGFATMMIGMVVILPVLGYASWHAYRDLIE